ncbi:hypothetical protein MTR_5g011415 [Medicago truncatula]|uniref:Uncharacterized protein n=1 Tax=Medicago truncatula TaxID=3880 RepID=A0A072UDD8_MEDTR|nr:hypothetical protein MTR_5g011415 [Medicago truncatula]
MYKLNSERLPTTGGPVCVAQHLIFPTKQVTTTITVFTISMPEKIGNELGILGRPN